MVKECNLKTHIEGYHAYRTKRSPKNGEILDQKLRTSMTNTQSQLKDVVMWLDVFLKEGLHVSPKPFRILRVQEMKTVFGLK